MLSVCVSNNYELPCDQYINKPIKTRENRSNGRYRNYRPHDYSFHPQDQPIANKNRLYKLLKVPQRRSLQVGYAYPIRILYSWYPHSIHAVIVVTTSFTPKSTPNASLVAIGSKPKTIWTLIHEPHGKVIFFDFSLSGTTTFSIS